MSSRNPTAPNRIHSVASMSPTTASRAGSTTGRNPAFARIGAAPSSGKISTRFEIIASSSARTCPSVEPSAIRATPLMPKAPSCRFSRSSRSGRHRSISCCEKENPGGMTPTTSTLSPSISTTRPTTPGSAPNRLRHRPSLSTITGAAPGRSSSVVNERPRRGGVRSTSKNDAVTFDASTRWGFSGPVKLTCSSRYAATPPSVLLSSAYRKWSASDTGSSSSCARPGAAWRRITSRSESGIGSGRSSTALTMAKMATLAPTPTASVSSERSVNPGFARTRRKKRRSWEKNDIGSSTLSGPACGPPLIAARSCAVGGGASARPLRMAGSETDIAPMRASGRDRSADCTPFAYRSRSCCL